jgi:hypothetical protein
MSDDVVNHPPHYTSHPSGVECIDITETMDFNPGNSLKYVWRFREKGGRTDLDKALWYVRREIELRKKDIDGMTTLSNTSRVMAYETDPIVAMIFWYLTAGDCLRRDKGITAFREAERLIEGLIHDTEPTPR